MTPTTNPYTALRRFLLSDPSVYATAGGRVFVVELPDKEIASMPRSCVIIRGTGGGQMPASTGYLEVGDIRIDIACYGETPLAAFELNLAVRGALKQMRRNVQAATVLHWAQPAGGPNTEREPDTEWPLTLSTWQVLWSERGVTA